MNTFINPADFYFYSKFHINFTAEIGNWSLLDYLLGAIFRASDDLADKHEAGLLQNIESEFH